MKKINIHKTAEVSPRTIIGEGTNIWHYAQVREGVNIGTNCTIGKGAYVDNDVIIGNGVKIQNGVSVYRGVTIEDDVILGPNCTFTNDPHPRAFPAGWEISSTLLKKGCSIGANATIVCGITIGEYSLIGAGAVVTEDTLPYSMMVGNPARLRCFVCYCGRELRKTSSNGPITELLCSKCKRVIQLEFKITEP